MRLSKILPYFLISTDIIISDQITKTYIVNSLVESESRSVLGDLIQFRLVYNLGGAMGTSFGPSWLYTILTVIALVFIVHYFIRTRSENKIAHFSLSLIFGGAIGNLMDRIHYGKVVDFIDIDFPDVSFLNLYRWYTFNIADASITVGLIIFAICILFRPEQNNSIQASPNINPSSPLSDDKQ